MLNIALLASGKDYNNLQQNCYMLIISINISIILHIQCVCLINISMNYSSHYK